MLLSRLYGLYTAPHKKIGKSAGSESSDHSGNERILSSAFNDLHASLICLSDYQFFYPSHITVRVYFHVLHDVFVFVPKLFSSACLFVLSPSEEKKLTLCLGQKRPSKDHDQLSQVRDQHRGACRKV